MIPYYYYYGSDSGTAYDWPWRDAVNVTYTVYVCPVCGERFLSYEEYLRHIIICGRCKSYGRPVTTDGRLVE